MDFSPPGRAVYTPQERPILIRVVVRRNTNEATVQISGSCAQAALFEIVTVLDVRYQARAQWLPPQELTGKYARRRVVD